VLTPLEFMPKSPPGSGISGAQLRRTDRLGSRRHGGEQPYRPAQDHPRRGAFAPGRAPLVMPGGAKEVLQVIVGAR
jgi:hypothetical protein